MNLGVMEIGLILVVVLLMFGPSKLPSLGKSLGEAIKGFKKGLNDLDEKPAEIVRETKEALNDSGENRADKSSTSVKDKNKV